MAIKERHLAVVSNLLSPSGWGAVVENSWPNVDCIDKLPLSIAPFLHRHFVVQNVSQATSRAVASNNLSPPSGMGGDHM